MNIFQLSIFSSLVATLVLGVLVFLTKSKRPVNGAFLTLSLVLVAYLSCFAGGSLTDNEDLLAFWIRQTSATSALVPWAMTLLRLSITCRRGWAEILPRSMPFLLTGIAAGIVCQTYWFLHGAKLPAAGTTVGVPEYGPGFALFASYMVAALAFMVRDFYRDLRSASGLVRSELEFVLMGCGGSLCFGIFFLFLPLVLHSQEIGQFLPLCVIVLYGIIAYGIATSRILDVPQVLNRVTAYILLTVYLGIVYLAVWYPVDFLIRHAINTELALPQLFATVAVALSVAPSHGHLQRFVNRLFGSTRAFDPASMASRGLRVLGSISTLDELLAQFATVTREGVGTDRAIVLLREDGTFRQAHPASDNPLIVPATDPLMIELGERQAPLAADLLPRYTPGPLLADAGHRLEQLNASVAVGIGTRDRIDALLLLGPRLSGRIYSSPELDTLQMLADHLAVALENAKLYTQVQDNAIYTNNLLEHLVSGVIAAGPDRRITVFNREAQRVTGMTPAETIGQPIEKLPAPLAAELGEVFGAGTGPREKELTLDSGAREKHITIRAGSTLFHGSKGQLLGALLVFHDVSAVKRLESQVRRGDRLASMGTLAAGMAHEIKNPLQTLKTFTQLLGERYEDPEFRGSFTNLVGSEVQRIDALVNQLLRFARPAKPVLIPMHLHSIVENALLLLQQQMNQHKIAAVRKLDAPSDCIRGDADLLHQTMVNFALNAIEAMPQGGSLTVHTEVLGAAGTPHNSNGPGSWLRLSISDTGTGIAPDVLPHIFDPFYTTKNTGTGLGLSVSHGIVTEHGGLIDVESVQKLGTTFRLLFPLCHAEAPA